MKTYHFQIENSTSSSIGKNRSMTDPSSLDTSFAWAYEECPDIDECKLNIHKCHSKVKELNFCHTLNFYNPFIFAPDGVNLGYFKLRLCGLI